MSTPPPPLARLHQAGGGGHSKKGDGQCCLAGEGGIAQKVTGSLVWSCLEVWPACEPRLRMTFKTPVSRLLALIDPSPLLCGFHGL